MDHSVQGCFLPQNTCPSCGAGPHNNNRHDENCLSGVPVPFMPLWRRGFEAQLNAGYGGKVGVPESFDYEADLAFAKGVAMAAKKLDAERTTRSLEQAVEIAQTLRP